MDWPNPYFKHVMEYLGGERDDQPAMLPISLASPIWGIWWGILLLLILVFCGQSSKFIYIDF